MKITYFLNACFVFTFPNGEERGETLRPVHPSYDSLYWHVKSLVAFLILNVFEAGQISAFNRYQCHFKYFSSSQLLVHPRSTKTASLVTRKSFGWSIALTPLSIYRWLPLFTRYAHISLAMAPRTLLLLTLPRLPALPNLTHWTISSSCLLQSRFPSPSPHATWQEVCEIRNWLKCAL